MSELCITLENLVKTLNKIADFIEVDTKDHSRKVKHIATSLGIQTGWEDEKLLFLGYGADIHDIGKIAINQAVFRQPTKLTRAQYIAVQGHPDFGVEMLRYCKVPKIIADCVHYHHEHWDGSGYPMKLKGKEIPECAAIVCLADVWESVTSDRPYRRAMQRDVALKFMEDHKSWFHPGIYSAFIVLSKRGDL